MKKNFKLLWTTILFLVVTPVFSQVSNDNEDEVNKIDARASQYDFVNGQVLVKFSDQQTVQVRRSGKRYAAANDNALTEVLQKYGVEEMEQLLPNENPQRPLRKAQAFNGSVVEEKDLSQLYCVKLSEEHVGETMQLVDELQNLEEVEFAEPNYKLYTLEDVTLNANFAGNPYVNSQWYLDDYGVKQLWNKPIINKTRPIIAILDTGVDMTHPDLVDNLWTNQKEANGEKGYDNDGNGFKNDVHGWDFINNTPNVRDYNMHGTHVAGIAAAANNGIGIVGANPKAYIMPISVMQSDGTGDVATIIKGIDYAVANGATVLNLSLGTYANSRALRQALEKAYQSTIIVAAAGNDGRCINTPHFHNIPPSPMFPAAYSFVLGVQATTNTGALAGFSNYDDDGNTFSSVTTLQDPDGFNYELNAPGTNMLSTIPGGKYKVLNGTSMAAPLVAGAISALKMVKQYDTQEILWGDLLHTDNIAQAYAVTNRPAELDLMKIMYRERKELSDETEEDYGGDGRIDAGETVSLYPVIRTTFGEASNIKMHLEMGDEFEDPNTVQILTGVVDFGLHLDAYGKGVSMNPLKFKVAENVANGRHIKMKFVATCDETNVSYEGHFTIIVDNISKIGGLISEDKTLTADHVYFVNENIGVLEGVTLTIEPGAHLMFAKGKKLASFGKLIANGTPKYPIVFEAYHKGDYWEGITSSTSNDTISYCEIDGAKIWPFKNIYGSGWSDYGPYMKDCILTNSQSIVICKDGGERNNYYYNEIEPGRGTLKNAGPYCNFIDNYWKYQKGYSVISPQYSMLNNCNYFNSFRTDGALLEYYSTTPSIDHADNPSYLGTSCEDIARQWIWESYKNDGFGQIDLSNMRTIPIAEAHGIVWKVCVNGKDAQDQYEDLAPLGVGKHKFEVYFNRPMNKGVTPNITFGVREPYTQNAVNEDGSWNDEGTIYTAYKTIIGKTKSDGVNRIYVYGAEDNEYFECPYEKTRFNVMINAAGSMATGLVADAGMGRVSLTWKNENNDFDDAMGFNIYRYTINETDKADTLRLNTNIVDIETTEYTDYDVTPGETYYYLYKVLSTDLQEYDVSNVVAATPLTSTLGDANGSGEVDVADVITTVNYAAGMDPKPFIFEAADMNTDTHIDILDVVGIIQKILNPSAGAKARVEAVATYTVEDGIVYVESPVDLAGVQVQLNTPEQNEPSALETLNGFEHASAWLTDEDYLFLGYNMNGKTIPAGKHALFNIGNAQLRSIRLSDTMGGNVMTEAGNATAIEMQTAKVLPATHGIYNLNGQKIAGSAEDLERLPKGVYVVDGVKVVKTQ